MSAYTNIGHNQIVKLLFAIYISFHGSASISLDHAISGHAKPFYYQVMLNPFTAYARAHERNSNTNMHFNTLHALADYDCQRLLHFILNNK